MNDCKHDSVLEIEAEMGQEMCVIGDDGDSEEFTTIINWCKRCGALQIEDSENDYIKKWIFPSLTIT